MESIVAELKQGCTDDIDVKVERCLAGFGGMKADQRKAVSTYCVKLMHACLAVIGQLDDQKQAAAIKAIGHCYKCIEASSFTAQLNDALTVAKIAYHLMTKLLNMGSLQAALSCSDCILKELLLHTGKAAPSDLDNIAQNASAALWSIGKSALDSNASASKDRHAHDVITLAPLLGRSLCFVALCSTPDSQLLVANFERVANRILQRLAATSSAKPGAGAGCGHTALVGGTALGSIAALYADLIGLPWASLMPQFRLLACIQCTAFLVQCQDTAAALTRLDARIWGLAPLQEQQHACPAISSAWAALTAALRLYVLIAGGSELPLCTVSSSRQKPRTTLADLTESLDQFVELVQIDQQLHADELLWLAVVDPVRLLLEAIKDNTHVLTDVTSLFGQHGAALLKFVETLVRVLGLYQDVLLAKLNAQLMPLTPKFELVVSDRRRLIVKRLQQSVKAGVSAVTVLLTAVGLNSGTSSILGQEWASVAAADSGTVIKLVEQVAAVLETAVTKEPEFTKELSYVATLVHNAGLRLMESMRLDEAAQLLLCAARTYERSSSIKVSADVQDKWRSSLAGLSECYQRSSSWVLALRLVAELLKTGMTIEKCVQQWVCVKRSFVKKCMTSEQNLSETADSKLGALTMTMREPLIASKRDIAEDDIVDTLLKELKAYMTYNSSSTSKTNTTAFYLAELAVVKDLLSSHAVSGCHRAYALLRRSHLQLILSPVEAQDETAASDRSLLEDCEAALSALSDDQSSAFFGDAAALAYFTSYAIQHLGTLTIKFDFVEVNLRQQGDVVNSSSNNVTTASKLSKPTKLDYGQHCGNLGLLDQAISIWSTSIHNGSLLFCEEVTLSCLEEAASIFALFDMPGRELECLLLTQQVLSRDSRSVDAHKDWYERQANIFARLVTVSLHFGLFDVANGYLVSLRNTVEDSTHSKASRHASDRVRTILTLAEAEWLLHSGQVDKAIAKADQIIESHTGGSSGSDCKAALTSSNCLYLGMASRLMAVAGSEHGSVCLPRCVSVLEHAHDAVRMHTSLHSFAMGKQEYSCWPAARDVSSLTALRELMVSLDVSVMVHLLAEDVRSVRCYCKEGLCLSRALPLRAATFLLHLAKADALSASHGDCQTRLDAAAHLLNAAADGEAAVAGSSDTSPPLSSKGLPVAIRLPLTCASCRRLAEAQPLSLVSEGGDDSEDSFIRSKPLLQRDAAGCTLGPDDDGYNVGEELNIMSSYGTDMSVDPTASPRLGRRSALPAVGLAALYHEPSCTCVGCGGGNGRFSALQQLLVMHAVRQAEASLAEGEADAAVRLASDALAVANRFEEKAKHWSLPARAAIAAAASTTVFAKPAIAAGRALLEVAMEAGDCGAAELAWRALVKKYAADGLSGGANESRLAEAEVFFLLPALSHHVTNPLPGSHQEQLAPAVPLVVTKPSILVAASADYDGRTSATSPCAADGTSYVAELPPRQKVKKSRIKKAVHFDDSDPYMDESMDAKPDTLEVQAARSGNAHREAIGSHTSRSSTPANGRDRGPSSAATPHRTTALTPLSLNSTQADGVAKQRPASSAPTHRSGRVRGAAKAKENVASVHAAGGVHFSVFRDESKEEEKEEEEQQQQSAGGGSAPRAKGLGSSQCSAPAAAAVQPAELAGVSKHRARSSRVATSAAARSGRRQLCPKTADLLPEHAGSGVAASAGDTASLPATAVGGRRSARQRIATLPFVETLRAADSDSSPGSPADVMMPPRQRLVRPSGTSTGTSDKAAGSSSSSIGSSRSNLSVVATVTRRRLAPAVSSASLVDVGSYVDRKGECGTGSLPSAKQHQILRKDASVEMDHDRAQSGFYLQNRVPAAKAPVPRRPVSVRQHVHGGHSEDSGHIGDRGSPTVLESMSVAVLCQRLENALVKLGHFPPAAAYRAASLALAASYHRLGEAGKCALHMCQSVALTFQHVAQRNYSRKLRRAAKTAVPGWRREQLSRCQELLQFARNESSFTSAVERLPDGWSVCQLSVITDCTGDSINRLYITRLQRGQAPLVCLVPAFSTIGKDLLAEFADIMTRSADSMLLSDYKAWWTERTMLNKRMQELTEHLESQLLCCWKGMLAGTRKTTSSPPVSLELDSLRERFMVVTGLSDEHFRVWLEAAATCRPNDVLQSLTHQVALARKWQTECNDLGTVLEQLASDLVVAAAAVFGEAVSERHPTLLVLDKKLQHLPWESMPILRMQQVTRMPSLAFIDAHLTYHRLDMQSITNVGIDNRKTFYVLNPEGNLQKTEDTFKTWFTSESGWDGIIGREPSGQQLVTALAEADIFLYCGHGSGSKYLDGESIQTLSCRPASVLMGCSSGALAAKGSLDCAGMVLNYFLGGSPCIIANLWDVTDRDIDRFLKALLSIWVANDGSHSEKSLLKSMGSARSACKLPFMIGASPVVYGLPLVLK